MIFVHSSKKYNILRMVRIFGILFFFFVGINLYSQSDVPISIEAVLYDPMQKQDFLRVIIANQRSGVGKFGDQDGRFNFTCQKKDTLIISVIGYETLKLSFADSLYKPHYMIRIALKRLEINLREVSVFPKRELEKIYRDIDRLGYNESDYKISGVDALQSPITFLYESFSRRAQKNRLAIELQNEERRRDLLKELLGRYVDASIIDLEPREFDVFIDYCKISDFILQNATQYQFIQIIRDKFKEFKRY